MLDQIKRYMRKRLGAQSSSTPISNEVRNLIERLKQKKLTYLSDRKLNSLATTCLDIEEKKLEGLFMEAGCALGGSSILMASIKTPKRRLQIYDVFGMIPPPTDQDTEDVHERYKTISEGKSTGIGGDKYYGYEENLYEIVLSNFRDFGIDCEK